MVIADCRRPVAIALRVTFLIALLAIAAGPLHAQNARQVVPAEVQQARDKAQAYAATPAAREERARGCLAPTSKTQAAQCETEFGYCAQAKNLNLNETYKQLCAGAGAAARRALPAMPAASADQLTAERERRAVACLKVASRPAISACEQEFGYCARAAELPLGDAYRASCAALDTGGTAARQRVPLLAAPTVAVPDADKCREPGTKAEVAQCERHYGYCARSERVKLNELYLTYCAAQR